MLDLTSFSELYPECVLYYKFTVAVSSYVARRFGCFTVSVAGRSNAARCRRHLFSYLATDLPVGVTSCSPSLKERWLLPVHQSVGQVISCSGKVMRTLAGIYGDVSEVLYPVLVFY